MRRGSIALSAILVGLAGVLSVHALPWLAISSSAGTEYVSFHELDEGAVFGGTPIARMATGLSFILHAFLWGSVLMAVAYAGLLLRPIQRQLGEAIATVGVVAVASSVFFVLGAFFFAVNVGALDDALIVGDAWYGLNYVTPALMLAFVGLSAWHAVEGYPHARDALTHHHSVPVRDADADAPASAAEPPAAEPSTAEPEAGGPAA